MVWRFSRHIEVVEAGPDDARSTYKLVGYDSTGGMGKVSGKTHVFARQNYCV